MHSNFLRRDTNTSQKVSMLMAVALAVPVTTQVVQAGGYGGSTSSIAQTEIARRAALVEESDTALLAGRKAFTDKNFEESVKQYQIALNLLPPGPALSDRRNSYTGHLGDASIALAQQYTRNGRYDEARALLEGVKATDPGNLVAAKRLEYLDDPIRINPALTYEHTQNAKAVGDHLRKAEGYYNLARFDDAIKENQKVLRIDKTNKAARRAMERANNAQADYYRAANDQTRIKMLKDVAKAWELAVPAELPTVRNDFNPGGGAASTSGVQYIQRKLNEIIIPSVDFDGVTVEEAIDDLRLFARELDRESDESRRGLNFVLRSPVAVTSPTEGASSEVGNIGTRRIGQLSLTNVPLGKVLDYIRAEAQLKIKIDDFAITLSDANEDSEDLHTRHLIVPPDFISKLSSGNGGTAASAANDDPFNPVSGGATSLGAQPTALDLLKNSGIAFGDNASASYLAATSTLIVTNTLSQLDAVERLVENTRIGGANQVLVRAKFIEISQENTDELGFDWAITSGIDLGGANTLTGGTLGSGNSLSGTDFSNGYDPTNGGTVTAGNRTGTFAISGNSIDSLIDNPDRATRSQTAAPGILSLTGVFGEDQLTTIMRGLAQKKGTDIMTAPSVLAKNGKEASINVIREFIYPTEYEPPELPNNVGTSSSTNALTGATTSTFPVTPATPTAFTTKNIGVSLIVTPTIGVNNYTIDLQFAPEIVEFEGFINYGSPIQSAASNSFGVPISVTVTDNRIEMPVFSIRKVQTSMVIYDGYTVAVGGLMREDVQNVEDKVPILGDLPIVGRLFQTKAENRIKSNLIIFVTAEIVDPAGLRVNQPVNSGSSSISSGGVLPPLPGS